MEQIFKIFLNCLVIFIAFQLLFYTGLAFWGLKKPKREYSIKDDQLSFLFLIPACNEENVIEDTLKNLRMLNYDRNLFDIVTLVNNSKDSTYEKSNALGVKTLDIKFGANEPKGKPYVLQKYFDNNIEWKNYDYVVILDADNIISSSYLKEVNSQILCERYKNENIICVQGYLGIKNITSSLVSSGYSGSYFFANRGVQYAKHRLGLNPAIGGTGFVLKSEYIKEKGWNPRSYTEDFELQVELAIEGERSLWNHFARVYDEKPVTVKASHKQRTRWCQGHWYVAITKTPKQLLGLFKSTSLRDLMNRFEVFLYSYTMSRTIVLSFILSLAIFVPFVRQFLPSVWSWLLIWMICQVCNYFIFPIYYILNEGKLAFSEQFSVGEKIKNFIQIYVGFFYTSIIYIAAQLVGFFTAFRPQNNWVKTSHAMTEDDVVWHDEDVI
ncbi:glycosyltransferase [Clostridium sardiniense]|uniref:glycosyltransferase n=1 Tax=Clostridium sardiniense TaxID=29369 RepID=UPI00195643A5|nr:glycosyltransferase [Clostridium sardiniense]MBM7835580.1 cellulose synthase/poly-beta-1,6-N-acetylglucosamine synthase-like glycosyltransferase [Clostridium sardiniense]